MIQPLPLESPTSDENSSQGAIPNLVPFLLSEDEIAASGEPFTKYEQLAIKHRIADIVFQTYLSEVVYKRYITDSFSQEDFNSAMREHDENTAMPIDDLMAKYPEVSTDVLLDFVLSARSRPMYQWGLNRWGKQVDILSTNQDWTNEHTRIR